jgi:hypothetical protein
MHHTDNSSFVASSGTTDFDVELCHAFVSTVAKSDLICTQCTKGLIERYLHSKGRDDLVFKVYRRINELEHPLLVSLMYIWGGPEEFKRAIQDLNDVPYLSQAPDATAPKQWDCVNNEDWGNLSIWLRILAKEESVIPHPLTNRDFRTSAWRSRVWAATAGVYSLDDLRSERSIQRFLDDHEARLFESCIWPAHAKIPRLANEITPAVCQCFHDDETSSFQDTVKTMSFFPEAPRDPSYICIHRKSLIAGLVNACFDPEIVEGVFHRCVPPAASETADPFQAFVEYWDSAPVKQAVRSLLGLAPETFPDAPAPIKAEQVTGSEKEPASKPLFSMRRGATFKHPGVDIGYQAYHPLTPSPWKEGPVDYEGEARRIQPRHNEEPENWFDGE